ncbi:hypothetical protein G6011_08489 [Alternaria panax]|uniref:XPG N-terminal domain-containing protein n=1 Tax=Alternaria panax TaxID=48097 RepID=A0AAD4FIU7_9PLEO|nr:hypothetical protein G6011_08489 [Alternaria panax]
MGIKHLYQLIEEHAPEAVKKGEIKNQFGRKVAIDAYEYTNSRTTLNPNIV